MMDGFEQTKQNLGRRLIDGARHYAAADRSDPFALDRAMTHIRVGICAPLPSGESAAYHADEYSEERSYEMGGVTVRYRVPAYKNLQRP